MGGSFDSQPDLFGAPAPAPGGGGFRPLAERVRPRKIDEMAGQEHLIGADGPLRRFLSGGQLPSMIFWGPPGSGKTTLAEICASALDFRFEQLSAIESGVKDVRRVLEGAASARSRGLRTLLFIDEIHRFNKSQQDTLLHAIEQGVVVLIGATTENPSFEVNAALLSRMQVYTLHALGSEEIRAVVLRALEADPLFAGREVQVPGLEFLLRFAGGDARKALNALEAAYSLVPADEGPAVVDQALLERALQYRAPIYDRGGEAHYNTVSAFIKSLRGSDPDAALFWLARMIEGGEDPRFIARRLVIFSSEDVGNADPYAITLAVSVFQAVSVIGMPEARINLGQAVTYLASCAKSNASYAALNRAMAESSSRQDLPVPKHLSNAPTKFMKQEGYGAGYRYPHDFPGHFVPERYFPEGMEPKPYYRPSAEGREKYLAERLRSLWPDRYDDGAPSNATTNS
ncbi:replication-associated recombination protein A [Chlorobium sp. N1]|uniref:replication-associated recombination protein A n=1 Tax=Chlorobium sp. N1 TaxID=2491138 RepID=UPI00103B38A3|nr:replication-associated recombination protein A [Chlorobium sp. N1]TCD47307.1 replication-associated recombination protein A [Chlorobium sp. N1]